MSADQQLSLNVALVKVPPSKKQLSRLSCDRATVGPGVFSLQANFAFSRPIATKQALPSLSGFPEPMLAFPLFRYRAATRCDFDFEQDHHARET